MRPSAARTGSVHPQNVRQRDSDVDLPCRKSSRAVSPRKPDAPAARVLSSATTSLVPHVDIYDGRPPILPVSEYPGVRPS